jgi:hypothetical protein
MLMGIALFGVTWFTWRAYKRRDAKYLLGTVACVVAVIALQAIGGAILANAIHSATGN